MVAKILGSVTDTQPEVEVGILPQKRARLTLLTEESKKCREELQKLQTISGYLAKAPEDDTKKMELKKSVSESLYRNNQLLSEYTEELNKLNQEFEHAAHGKVHAKDTAYPNVRITIASASYKINQPTNHATFKMIDGNVSFVPYEAN